MRDWFYTAWAVSVILSTGIVGAEVLPDVVDRFEAVQSGAGVIVFLVYCIAILGAAKLATEEVDSGEAANHV